MNLVSRFSAAVLALGLAASPAAAQLLSNPVYVNPNPGTGLTLNGEVGRGLNTASGKATSFNGRATLGMPMFQVTVGGGVMRPNGGGTSIANFMGQAVLKLPMGPAMPVNLGLFAGAGYASKSGTKTLSVPAGVVIGFHVPSPSASITPWVAPRINYVHTSITGGASGSSTHAGASAGLDVGLPMGLGFHAAVDYVYVKGSGGVSASTLSPFIIGGGISYKFTIPGLGMAGM